MAVKIKSVGFSLKGKDYRIMQFPHGTMFLMESVPGIPSKRIESGPIYELARDMVGSLRVFEQCKLT